MFRLFLKQMKGYIWAFVIIAYITGYFWLDGYDCGITLMFKDIRDRWRRAKKEYLDNKLEGK